VTVDNCLVAVLMPLWQRPMRFHHGGEVCAVRRVRSQLHPANFELVVGEIGPRAVKTDV